jgi:hypothetical protein
LIREYKDICVNKIIAGRTDKQYRIDNKEHIKQHGKQYYQNNKEYISAKHMCDCGIPYTRLKIARHKRSKRHIEYMSNPFIKINL